MWKLSVYGVDVIGVDGVYWYYFGFKFFVILVVGKVV